MIEIGKTNTRTVVKSVDFGVYLDGGDAGEILLPSKYVPRGCKAGDTLDVFIYYDSEDRIIATTQEPKAMVGRFAFLRVAGVTAVGAFLDWGLPKDLLVPFSEQPVRMQENKSYIVYLYLDDRTKRIVGSAKLNRFLDKTPLIFNEGQEVELFICERTDLGWKAVINDTQRGMLFNNDVHQPLKTGQRLKGYIKKIREDGKIDLCLSKPGYEKVGDISTKILEILKAHGGFIPVTDKSSPETIYRQFKISKKTFKMAVGALYKKRLISIEKNGLKMVVP